MFSGEFAEMFAATTAPEKLCPITAKCLTPYGRAVA